jgi:cell division protein FtsB
MGPMAQDFYTAFGLGGSDTTITSVDPDGVALAAIQGLNRKLTDELKQKETEIAKLEQRLEALEKIVRDQN